jgi:hypothetical protein
MPFASKVTIEPGQNINIKVNEVGIEASPGNYVLHRADGERTFSAKPVKSVVRVITHQVNQVCF